VLVALAYDVTGFVLSVPASPPFKGSAAAPSIGLIVQSGMWLGVATTVITTLAVGVASLTASRTLTLTAVIGWQTFTSTLLFAAQFLGSARDGVLLVALSRLRPGPDTGTREHAGSPNALQGFELPMAAATAVLVILVWFVAPTIAGARRTRRLDA
jgi:hypothetical protein